MNPRRLGYELHKFIAEKALGWQLTENGRHYLTHESYVSCSLCSVPEYSTDIGAAMLLVESLCDNGENKARNNFKLECHETGDYNCELLDPSGKVRLGFGESQKSFSEAIARMAEDYADARANA